MSGQLVPLGYCVAEVRRKNRNGQEQNLMSLSYGNIVRKDITSSEGLLPESFDTYNIVEAGDTVLRLTDLQNDQRSLRVGLVQERGIITSAYVSVRPGRDMDSRYLNYFLKHLDFRKEFYALGAGVRQSLKFDELRGIRVLRPSLEAQRAIADYLDTGTARIDALIAKKQRMIELLEEQLVRRLEQLLGVVDGASKGWVKLRYITRISGGLTLGKSYDGPTVRRPYLRVANVQDQWLDLSEVAEVDVPPAVADRFGLCPGDVLMLEGNGNPENLGRGVLWRGELEGCLHQNHVHAVRADTTLLAPEYLDAVVRTDWARRKFTSESAQVSIATLSQAQIGDLSVPLPGLSEQHAIVAKCRTERKRAVTLRSALQRQIELLRERRQALITAAVTGELEVTGVAA